MADKNDIVGDAPAVKTADAPAAKVPAALANVATGVVAPRKTLVVGAPAPRGKTADGKEATFAAGRPVQTIHGPGTVVVLPRDEVARLVQLGVLLNTDASAKPVKVLQAGPASVVAPQ